jgi:hypothetical protein
MAILFFDGFESGTFVNWTDFTGTYSIVESPVHPPAGNYAIYMHPGSNMKHVLDASVNLLYMRFYIQLNEAGPDMVNGDLLNFARIIRADGDNLMQVCLKNNGGTIQWGLGYDNNTMTWANTSTNPSLNTWYCVEFNGVRNGTSSLWINGLLLLDSIGAIVDQAIPKVQILNANWGNAYPGAYFDDIILSDEYIGPETSGTPFITVDYG